jgi:biotin carboxyl carrier protein
MPKKWNQWKKYFEKDDTWQYDFEERKIDYSEVKKLLICVVLFVLLYGVHVSGTRVGLMVDEGIRNMLTTNTDFIVLGKELEPYIPKTFDREMLQKVKSVVAQPADPLSYMSMPIHGEIVTVFGQDCDGVEYQADAGSQIKAVSTGRVKAVTNHAKYGKLLIVEHGQSLETVYGYLDEVFVKEGDRVSQGQTIAKSGKKPADNKPMLYFELREKSVAVDPLTRIKGDFPPQGGA